MKSGVFSRSCQSQAVSSEFFVAQLKIGNWGNIDRFGRIFLINNLGRITRRNSVCFHATSKIFGSQKIFFEVTDVIISNSLTVWVDKINSIGRKYHRMKTRRRNIKANTNRFIINAIARKRFYFGKFIGKFKLHNRRLENGKGLHFTVWHG